jgi:hypothetical protein
MKTIYELHAFIDQFGAHSTRILTLLPLSEYHFLMSFIKYSGKQRFNLIFEFDTREKAAKWSLEFGEIVSKFIKMRLEEQEQKKKEKKGFFSFLSGNPYEPDDEESLKDSFPKELYILEKIKI